jgi:sorbitol/mannitol transport system substrate-binding protein
MANITTMVYRKDVFDDLGLEAPTTYDELIDAAAQIQDQGDFDHPIALPLSDNGSTLFEGLLRAQDASYLDPETDEPTFAGPEATTALQTLTDLSEYMDPQATSFDQPRVQQQLFNGKAAIAIMFSGRMADLLDENITQFSEDFAFAPPPAVTDGGPVGATVSVDGWSIPTNTDVDPDLLFRLMAASISEDASLQSVPAAYPARNGVATDENTPYAAAVQDAMDNGAATPPMETWLGNVQNAVSPLLQEAFSGEKSVADVLAESQKAAEQALADTE